MGEEIGKTARGGEGRSVGEEIDKTARSGGEEGRSVGGGGRGVGASYTVRN